MNTRGFFFILLALYLTCCQSITYFDNFSYQRNTELKVETLHLLKKGLEDYSDYKKEVEELELNLLKAVEYERGRPLNAESLRQWEKLQDPQGDLIGGVLADWKKKRKLREFFVQEKLKQIEMGFDEVIKLESLKRSPVKQ